MALPRLRPVALSLLFAFSAAQAQENTLSAVNATAKGYSTSDLETPLSTVALDRDEIIRRGAANVGDALRSLSSGSAGKWASTPVTGTACGCVMRGSVGVMDEGSADGRPDPAAFRTAFP